MAARRACSPLPRTASLAQSLPAPQSRSVFDNSPADDVTRPQEVEVFVDVVEADGLEVGGEAAVLDAQVEALRALSGRRPRSRQDRS